MQQQLRRADSASELTSYSFAQIAGIMRSAVRSQVAGRAPLDKAAPRRAPAPR